MSVNLSRYKTGRRVERVNYKCTVLMSFIYDWENLTVVVRIRIYNQCRDWKHYALLINLFTVCFSTTRLPEIKLYTLIPYNRLQSLYQLQYSSNLRLRSPDSSIPSRRVLLRFLRRIPRCTLSFKSNIFLNFLSDFIFLFYLKQNETPEILFLIAWKI